MNTVLGFQAARTASCPTYRWPFGAGEVESKTTSRVVSAIAASRWCFAGRRFGSEGRFGDA